MPGSIVKRFTLPGVLIAFAALMLLVAFGLYAMQVALTHLERSTLEELKQSVLVDTDKLERAFDLAQADLPILSRLPPLQNQGQHENVTATMKLAPEHVYVSSLE